MRIQKYFSEQGILSRRETEEYIKKGLITVNGNVVKDLGTQIDPVRDKVAITSAGNRFAAHKETVAIYKPRGIVCSKVRGEGQTVFDILPRFKRLNIVGRLDRESEGLLLLSSDGVVTSAVTGGDHSIEKEYEVTIREPITASKAGAMKRGMKLEDGPTLPAKVRIVNPRKFIITLREGRKHQIRRMSAKVGLTVTSLKRIRIGDIRLGTLKPGQSRPLERAEVAGLIALAK